MDGLETADPTLLTGQVAFARVTEREDTSDLAAALDQFDRTQANLAKVDQVWQDFRSMVPDDLIFGLDSDTSDDLARAFVDIADALPAIDGFRIDAAPMALDAIAQARFDAMEVGEIEAKMSVENAIDEPGRQIAEYRYRLDRTRRNLVRNRVMEVIDSVEDVLRDVSASEGLGEWRGAERWGELTDLVSQLDRLVGSMVPGRARWNDLHRHLRFAMSNDLSDIATMDWPSVRAEVESSMYTDREPIPVSTDDLGELARARPTGPVSTRLRWDVLTDDDFERLIFELIRQTAGYENANWLMKTHAPDRGRDLEVYRVVADPLAGTRRYRVIVQCKQWLTKTVGRSDLIECVESVKLWEPPIVDELIIATTGRFSSDAVALAEKRNHERTTPAVQLWPDSHLEGLLARRPSLVTAFGLRYITNLLS
jgi:hypothetical protein